MICLLYVCHCYLKNKFEIKTVGPWKKTHLGNEIDNNV